MARVSTLASRPDHPQGPRRHAVDAPVRVAVQVANGDAEPAVVGPDDVEVKAGAAGDVELGLLAGVGSLVVLACPSPGRLCNEREMISWDSRNGGS